MIKCILSILLLVLSISINIIACTPQDPLTNTVIETDLIALGTITDKEYDVEILSSGNTTSKWAWTLFTLSIEKVVKGDSSLKKAIFRVPGGYVNGMFQPPTEQYFSMLDHVLLSLAIDESGIYRIFVAPCTNNRLQVLLPEESGVTFPFGYGVLWMKGEYQLSEYPLEEIMGRICRIMRLNNIPISLNDPCPELDYQPEYPPCHPHVLGE